MNIEDLKKLFEEMHKSLYAILYTKRAGEVVDNGVGLDFDLAPYAIIYSGGNIFLTDADYEKFFEFENANKTDIMAFHTTECNPNPETLINELKERDGYEVIWRLNQKDEAQ